MVRLTSRFQVRPSCPLFVCLLAFGMRIPLIAIDSLSSPRGKGEDGFLGHYFPSVDLPHWPTATGLERVARTLEQGDYYLQAPRAPPNVACVYCYFLIPPSLCKHRAPVPRIMSSECELSLVVVMAPTSARDFLLLASDSGLEKCFHEWKLLASVCRFSTTIFHDLILFFLNGCLYYA